MDRSEHLSWCKQRALEYVAIGQNYDGFASFMSDMSNHEETENHLALEMGMKLMLSGNLDTKREMKNWIEGFN